MKVKEIKEILNHEIMPAKEAAKYLGFKSMSRLYKLVFDREIPFHKRPGKGIRGGSLWFIRAELDAWRDSGRREQFKKDAE